MQAGDINNITEFYNSMSNKLSKARFIFHDIKPYISSLKSKELEDSYADIFKKTSEIKLKTMIDKNYKLSDDKVDTVKKLIIQENHLYHDLVCIIEREISVVADKLRKFDM